jgi:transposase-like protein
VFLDATYCKVRIGQRVVSQAVVIATGVSADGRREVLGYREQPWIKADAIEIVNGTWELLDYS